MLSFIIIENIVNIIVNKTKSNLIEYESNKGGVW